MCENKEKVNSSYIQRVLYLHLNYMYSVQNVQKKIIYAVCWSFPLE